MFVLIHSPLVGPSVWEPVLRELARRGRRARIPSFAGVANAPAPQWRYCVQRARATVEQVKTPVVLVGHSGAGPLLPAIAEAVSNDVAALIFVDSFLPAGDGSGRLLPTPLLEQLRGLATEGVLPPWSRWFGDDALRELVPDDVQRAELEREMPRLPLAYFEAGIPAQVGWDRRPCGYVLLSGDQYGQSAGAARDRGWPVLELPDAHHLSLVTDSAAVADALLRLTHDLAPATPPDPPR